MRKRRERVKAWQEAKAKAALENQPKPPEEKKVKFHIPFILCINYLIEYTLP